MIKSSDIPAQATTGIGSLPYRQSGPALERAFAVDIPYFPTLPSLDPREGMLVQALSGFPGIFWKTGGGLSIEWSAWERGREALSPGLGVLSGDRDFASNASGGIWELFLERSARDSRAWVKTQLLGPVTAVTALGGWETAPPEQAMELLAQLSEWLCARALAMVTELSRRGKRVLIFWDEPALGTPEAATPAARWAAEHLVERIQELKNAGALVGLHCCGRWDVAKTLAWPLDVLSCDLALSGTDLLAAPERLRAFRARGGRLALGLVPTILASTWNSRREVEQWRTRFAAALGETEAKAVLAESLLTPACGLGLRTVAEAEAVFRALEEIKKYL